MEMELLPALKLTAISNQSEIILLGADNLPDVPKENTDITWIHFEPNGKDGRFVCNSFSLDNLRASIEPFNFLYSAKDDIEPISSMTVIGAEDKQFDKCADFYLLPHTAENPFGGEVFAVCGKDELEETLEALNEQMQEMPKEVSIVESSDGYVLNVDAPVTASNVASLADHGVENGNEVKQATPKETTNNIADTRPNVHLEQASDVGTKEIAEINSGNGTDKDIETLAESAPSYEEQTDKSSGKQNKSKGNELDR